MENLLKCWCQVIYLQSNADIFKTDIIQETSCTILWLKISQVFHVLNVKHIRQIPLK